MLLQYSRSDDFLAGNPAPECKIRLKVGAKKSGELTALDSDMIFDSGSASGSPLSIAAILMGGYYRCPNLRIHGYETQTHRPSSGSYRAPGAQQGTFAIESVMSEMADRLGIDPLELPPDELRGRGRRSAQRWSVAQDRPSRRPRSHAKASIWQRREEIRASGKGIGVAIGGWPGGIEPATAVCRLDADGKLTVVLGSVDLNGTNTTFAQIAAEALGSDVSDCGSPRRTRTPLPSQAARAARRSPTPLVPRS